MTRAALAAPLELEQLEPEQPGAREVHQAALALARQAAQAGVAGLALRVLLALQEPPATPVQQAAPGAGRALALGAALALPARQVQPAQRGAVGSRARQAAREPVEREARARACPR